MNDLQKFVEQYNGVRNANFVMWGALLTMLARERDDGDQWLKELRELSLKELAATKTLNPADQFTDETARIAETARSVIGATFDMVEHRHKNSGKS